MKVFITAWNDVINPTTGKIHDEEGLRALDAIHYGPKREVEEVTDTVAEEMVAEFEKLYPDFCYDHIELRKGE
ncbi:MAG: hypothetical protein PUC72_05550 [Bacteroidales bacterium]|nr:hypothetical protein [Bacteroidales bacterium]